MENDKPFNTTEKLPHPIWNGRQNRQESDCQWKALSFIFATQFRIVGVYMNSIREDWHIENNVSWCRSRETVP